MNSPENSIDKPKMDGKKAGILALILAGGLAVAYHFMPRAETLNEDETAEFQKAQEDLLTLDGVKKVWAGRGVELSNEQAGRILRLTKEHLAVRKSKLENEALYKEVMPGAHYSVSRSKGLSNRSDVAKEYLAEERHGLAMIMQGGEPLKNENGDIIYAAEPMAEKLSRIALTNNLSISFCVRTDVEQAILYSGIAGKVGTKENQRVELAGDSVHQTGLACDFNNMSEIEDALANEGIVGGCHGTMYGSDYGHGSIGEMEERASLSVTMCKQMGPDQRAVAEKGGRVLRKAKNLYCDNIGFGCK